MKRFISLTLLLKQNVERILCSCQKSVLSFGGFRTLCFYHHLWFVVNVGFLEEMIIATEHFNISF